MSLQNDENPSGNMDGIDADALLAQIEGSGNGEIPMSAPAAQEPAAPPAAAPTAAELEFLYGDKPVKVPYTDPRVKQWAAQGYDYAQKMSEFNRRTQDFETREKALSPYKSIDDYAKQNPDWWQHVESSYAARKQAGGAGAAAGSDLETLKAQIRQELEAEIKPIKDFHTSFKEQKEDEALGQEIESIRKKYADLDWKTPDQHGQSLEARVVKHALDMGLDGSKPGHFRAAFNDFNHEHLVKLAADKAKEDQNKELQKRTKLGLLGTSPTPKSGIAQAEGVKNKTYNDLEREAKDEYGIA